MDKKNIRPYLVIPKLILQPTWGGTYIAETKRWENKPSLQGKKIGQSYELYDKSNLSLLRDTSDEAFVGEITNNKSVARQSSAPNSIELTKLIRQDPEAILGIKNAQTYGSSMHLLLKFTQALGNSFQLHIKDGTSDPSWKTKPESWYYFEPGIVTLGVKSGIDWQLYERCVTELSKKISLISEAIRGGIKVLSEAKEEIELIIRQANPWQYVNLVDVPKNTLIDLSPCGIHHSWEEDTQKMPLGNVLYEIQLNVMDETSTIRNFDKGKIKEDGSIRKLQITDYFRFIDRTTETNNPQTHMRKAVVIKENDQLCHERLLQTKYYVLDKLDLKSINAEFSETIDSFRHIFVKSGTINLIAADISLTVTCGHSVFIPSAVRKYKIRAKTENTNVLISY